MSTKLQNNWLPVIASLLRTLECHGFELDEVNNGEEVTELKGTARERRQKAKSEINATDESYLYVRDLETGKRSFIFIVLGNKPEELCADYTSDNKLDKALTEFSEIWEGVTCPAKKVKI